MFAVVQGAYVLGVSTRWVEDLVEALGISGLSKSEVSRICGALDAEVGAFRGRSLADETYPYLWLDATYVKVREAGRVVSMATTFIRSIFVQPDEAAAWTQLSLAVDGLGPRF